MSCSEYDTRYITDLFMVHQIHSNVTSDHQPKTSSYYKGIDGSARKPALIQDTEYMVEKIYHTRKVARFAGLF